MNATTTLHNRPLFQSAIPHHSNLHSGLWNAVKSNTIFSMPTGKAPGIDKIPLRAIKDCLPAILPTLTSIVSNSLTSGVFPSIWKTAEVIPIHKQCDHEKPENNRPISLLPILSKICETSALNQFMPYLELNKRLSIKQSGNKNGTRPRPH